MTDSNFYIKLRSGCGDVNIPLERDSVWTRCPVCRKEHQIPLDVLVDPETHSIALEMYVSCGDKRCEEKMHDWATRSE